MTMIFNAAIPALEQIESVFRSVLVGLVMISIYYIEIKVVFFKCQSNVRSCLTDFCRNSTSMKEVTRKEYILYVVFFSIPHQLKDGIYLSYQSRVIPRYDLATVRPFMDMEIRKYNETVTHRYLIPCLKAFGLGI